MGTTERERANDPWILFLLVSLLLAAKHPLLHMHDLSIDPSIHHHLLQQSLFPFLLLGFFFFFFFEADVQCLGLQVVGGAAEKERAAETVVGGGCIVNEGV